MHITSRYLFLNAGRARFREQVVKAFNLIERPKYIIALNEIGEGDKGYKDAKLVIEAVGDTHTVTHAMTREPIAIPHALTIKNRLSLRGSKGLVRQGPSRSIQETWIDHGLELPVEVVSTGHYHAGAMNGSRSPAVKAFLRAQYWIMLRKHKARAKTHYKAGRIYTWLMDTNWRKFPEIHPREVVLFSDSPDYARTVPPKGWRAKVIDAWEIDQPIESHHDVHGVIVEFSKI